MRVLSFLRDRLSWAVSLIVFAIRHMIEGEAPARDRRTFDVDCLDCDEARTYLIDSRKTACCASYQFVPSGKVKSRILRGTIYAPSHLHRLRRAFVRLMRRFVG